MKRIVFFFLGLWIISSQAQEICRIEYFIDNDPGFGNAIPVQVTQGSSVVCGFSLDMTGIESGFHLLFVRAQTLDRVWSGSAVVPVLAGEYNDPGNIIAMEYFIDNDPGFGSGTAINLNPGKNTAGNFLINLSGRTPGIHQLFIRALNAYGRWGTTENAPFLVVPATTPDIIRLEYFVDVDPGFGSGTEIPVTQGKDCSAVVPLDTTGLMTGKHVLIVRAMNAENRWSMIGYQDFTFLRTRLFLEGLYLPFAGMMYPAQDENGNHFGAEIADMVTLQIHDPVPPYPVIFGKEVGLKLNGTTGILINGIDLQQHYISVRHRNSIETWSAEPVDFMTPSMAYDFTTSAGQAFGDNQKANGDGTAAIYGGDVNQDGIVDAGDMNPVDNLATAVTFGYIPEDVNGDGIIDAGDMNIVDNNSTAIVVALVP